ncbi:hypothetical protein [Streptomyces sp. NPDC052496]|uniref:hypothetical protein n=1 Tax=Streptomyces sp. NPDC052496 TaxID=3154951 RepID=UPI00341294CC
MTEHNEGPQVITRRDHQAAEKVMKAILLVAAVVGAALLFYIVFFLGIFAAAA